MRRAPWFAALVLVAMLVPALVAGAAVDDTTLVTLSGTQERANGASGPGISISASGNRIAFESSADNLSEFDDNTVVNIFVRDMGTGLTALASQKDGVGATAGSANPSISADGRYVAFESGADNLDTCVNELDTCDDNSVTNVFLYDTLNETTELISQASDGTPADRDSGNPAVSGAGEVVAFESRATNLSADDDDAAKDIFTRRISAGTTTLVSRVNGFGPGGNGDSRDPTISSSGARVAFASDADNLYSDDRDLYTNIFVVVPQLQLMDHVSRTTGLGSVSEPANGNSSEPVISANGGFVAFTSSATNLAAVTAPTNVFLRYLSATNTSLVSRMEGQGPAATDSSGSPTISADGLQVAFTSDADNLSGSDNDQLTNVFLRHAYYGTMTLVSRASGANGAPLDTSASGPAISAAGDFVAFASQVYDVGGPRWPRPRPPAGFVHVLRRELTVIPTIQDPPPDLGLNDHSDGHGGGGGHGTGGHDAGAGHDAAGGHGADGHGAAGAAGHDAHGGLDHFRLVMGSLRPDKIFGTASHDKACGGAGNDTITLGAGSDVGYGGVCGTLNPPEKDTASWWRTASSRPALRHAGDPPALAPAGGADGNDRLVGGKGEDALFGGAGNDNVVGGSGRDLLSGGSGGDVLVGGPGRNRYEGGMGSDSINSANGVRELVDCGFGRDFVKADRRDRLSGCERVKRIRKKAKKDLPELLPECPGGGHDCHQGGTVVLRAAGRR